MTSGKFPFRLNDPSISEPFSASCLQTVGNYEFSKNHWDEKRPPKAILNCCFLGEHNGEGRRIQTVLKEGMCFTAGALHVLPHQLWLWPPPLVVLVLGGSAGQDLLGGHREKELRSPSRALLLEQLSVLFVLAASSSPSRKN